MAQDDLSTAFSHAAQALQESARQHKRAANAHRRQARASAQALDELRRACEARGIKLHTIPYSGGDTRHG